jgi:hypothetical protein
VSGPAASAATEHQANPADGTEPAPDYVQQLDALVQRGTVAPQERDKWQRALQEAEPRVRSYILSLLAARAEDPYLIGQGFAASDAPRGNAAMGRRPDVPANAGLPDSGAHPWQQAAMAAAATLDSPNALDSANAAVSSSAGPVPGRASGHEFTGGSLDPAEAELRAMRQRLQRGVTSAAAEREQAVPQRAEEAAGTLPTTPAQPAGFVAAAQPWTPPGAVDPTLLAQEPHAGGQPAWLREARAALQQHSALAADAQQRTRSEMQLRLLLLVAGQRDEALRPIEALSAAEQAYWREQLFALDTLLRGDEFPSPARRAAAAAQHLQQAMHRLADEAALVLRRVAFCRAVESYGVIQPFEKDVFRPGETVLLYVEVDHFTTQHTPQGHHAAFAADYQIFDSGRHRVAEESLPEIEEYCGNRRRDFFMSYRIRLPQSISAGRYTLLLNVTDTLGQKAASASVDFEIQ